MMNYPISLASYSFNGLQREGKIDIFGYLETLKYRYRVEYADIWTGFLPVLDDSFIKKVRMSMDDKGIQLANLCVDGPCLWAATPEQSEAHRLQMLQYIKAADILGAKTIRIDFGGGNTPMPEDAFEYIVARYKEYCGICYDLGMKIGPENHWGWDRVPANLRKVKEAVDHPAYGHLYHIKNFAEEDEGIEDFVISHAMHTHIPANSIPYAKEVIRKLAASGYQGTFSVEHHSGKHEYERVEWQLGSVRSIIAELKEEGIDQPAKPDYFQTIYK